MNTLRNGRIIGVVKQTINYMRSKQSLLFGNGFLEKNKDEEMILSRLRIAHTLLTQSYLLKGM